MLGHIVGMIARTGNRNAIAPDRVAGAIQLFYPSLVHPLLPLRPQWVVPKQARRADTRQYMPAPVRWPPALKQARLQSKVGKRASSVYRAKRSVFARIALATESRVRLVIPLAHPVAIHPPRANDEWGHADAKRYTRNRRPTDDLIPPVLPTVDQADWATSSEGTHLTIPTKQSNDVGSIILDPRTG